MAFGGGGGGKGTNEKTGLLNVWGLLDVEERILTEERLFILEDIPRPACWEINGAREGIGRNEGTRARKGLSCIQIRAARSQEKEKAERGKDRGLTA